MIAHTHSPRTAEVLFKTLLLDGLSSLSRPAGRWKFVLKLRRSGASLGRMSTRDATEFDRAVAKAEQAIERLVESRSAERVLEALERMLREQRGGTLASVEAPALVPVAGEEDVAVMLDANDFAVRAGISDQTVRNREKAGELFSVLWPMRTRGRLYPAFQLWSCVRGEPLERVLRELGDLDGVSKYQFFTTPVEHLASLSPLDVLQGGSLAVGTTERARSLLGLDVSQRTETVLRAAKATRSSRY